MPRKLPWGTTKPKPEPPAPEPPAKRQRRSPPPPRTPRSDEEDDEEDDDPEGGDIYMRPSDECYIMVEDEFLSIAQTYTRSLHRAEYERLQLQAKTKNARRISEIQRPVDGVTRMSEETLTKHELAANQRVREEALKGLPGIRRDEFDSDSDEGVVSRSVWGKSSLGMLMCSPKRRERDLSARWKINPGTRAAAGFKAAEVSSGVMKRRLLSVRSAEEHRRELRLPPTEEHSRKKSVHKSAPTKLQLPIEDAISSTETEGDEDDDEEDDDLDAPVARQSQVSKSSSVAVSRSQSFPSSLSQKPPQPYRRPTAPLSTQESLASSPPPPLVKREIPDFDFGLNLAAQQRATTYRRRTIAARKQAESQQPVPSSPVRQRQKLLDTLFPTGG